jgi:hypothetical protein
MRYSRWSVAGSRKVSRSGGGSRCSAARNRAISWPDPACTEAVELPRVPAGAEHEIEIRDMHDPPSRWGPVATAFAAGRISFRRPTRRVRRHLSWWVPPMGARPDSLSAAGSCRPNGLSKNSAPASWSRGRASSQVFPLLRRRFRVVPLHPGPPAGLRGTTSHHYRKILQSSRRSSARRRGDPVTGRPRP